MGSPSVVPVPCASTTSTSERAEPGVGQRGAQNALLRRAVRGGQPVGRAVLVDRRTADQRQHLVAVALGVGQPLDDENAAAVGESGAVGRAGERLAPAVGRQAALPAELHEDVGRGVDGDAAGEREVALTEAQRLHGHVQRDQRRRARGVDRHGRTLEAEHVGDPARRHAGGLTGQAEALGAVGADAVALGVDAREDAGGAAAQRRRVECRRAPRPSHASSRNSRCCGSMASASVGETPKKAGIEVGGVVEEAAGAGVGLARARRGRR